MSNEELLPFDFEEYKANPERLQTRDGVKAIRSCVIFGDAIAVEWNGAGMCCYTKSDYYLLRLTPKPRKKVRVRLCATTYGNKGTVRSDTGDVYAYYPHNDASWHWTSDPVEIEEYE